jgi:hypothetical protein
LNISWGTVNPALHYAWSCVSSRAGDPLDVCSNGTALPTLATSASSGTSGALTIPAGVFEIGVTVTFTVSVTLTPGNRPASSASATRTVVAGAPPEVSIQVTGFVGRDEATGTLRFNAGSTPTFTTLVERSTGRVNYAWSIVQDDPDYAQVDDPLLVWSTPTYLNTVRLRSHVLSPPSRYKFQLTSQDASGSVGLSTVSVLINAPPSSGTLAVVPGTGFAFDTVFALDAAGWEDVDLPLTYRFNDLGVVGDHASPSLLKDPSEASDCETLLGTGHNRTVQVVVADALGASATGTVGVWVQQQLLTQAEAETK